MRTRGIDLATRAKISKLATADNTNNNGLINGSLTNRLTGMLHLELTSEVMLAFFQGTQLNLFERS